jgi:hypothetical protein
LDADAANTVALLPTPTCASWLNRIWVPLLVFVELVIGNSDYQDWTVFDKVAQFFIPRRNSDFHDPASVNFKAPEDRSMNTFLASTGETPTSGPRRLLV